MESIWTGSETCSDLWNMAEVTLCRVQASVLRGTIVSAFLLLEVRCKKALQNRDSAHPVLPEPNTKHRELQCRNIGYFMMSGATQENRKLMLKSPNSLMACTLQIT